MVQKSINCQKLAILNKNMSFWPLKIPFSLQEPIWRLASLIPLWKTASFNIWHIHWSEKFYYCCSRMVWLQDTWWRLMMLDDAWWPLMMLDNAWWRSRSGPGPGHVLIKVQDKFLIASIRIGTWHRQENQFLIDTEI